MSGVLLPKPTADLVRHPRVQAGDLHAASHKLLTSGARAAPLVAFADQLSDAGQQRIDLGLTSPHARTIARRLTDRTGAIAGLFAHTGEHTGATPHARA